MGIQVVFDQHASFGIREMLMNQFIDTNVPVGFGALVGDFDMALIQQWCKEHEQIGSSLSAIFVIIAFLVFLLDRNALTRLADQLNRGFIETNQ
jgi:hypothetical protein